MKIKEGSVAEVYIFAPKPKDNVYLQWFEKDPSNGAKGPIYSFIIAEDNDGNAYISFDKNLEKFEVGDFYNEAVPNLRKAISKKLKINDNLAQDTLTMIQGIFEDEAEDLDSAPFNYKWIDTHINECNQLNRDMGFPENRLHIRIRSNTFSRENAKIEIKDPNILFDDSKLATAIAISTIEIS